MLADLISTLMHLKQPDNGSLRTSLMILSRSILILTSLLDCLLQNLEVNIDQLISLGMIFVNTLLWDIYQYCP